MPLTDPPPSRALLGRLLISIAVGLAPMLTSSARAEVNWLMGGTWVELEKPCTVRHPDGREDNVGMAFLESTAILYPPYGTDLDLPTSRLPARYEETGDAVRVRLELRSGETSQLVLRRAHGDQMRDSAGYLYRRCLGMMS